MLPWRQHRLLSLLFFALLLAGDVKHRRAQLPVVSELPRTEKTLFIINNNIFVSLLLTSAYSNLTSKFFLLEKFPNLNKNMSVDRLPK